MFEIQKAAKDWRLKEAANQEKKKRSPAAAPTDTFCLISSELQQNILETTVSIREQSKCEHLIFVRMLIHMI